MPRLQRTTNLAFGSFVPRSSRILLVRVGKTSSGMLMESRSEHIANCSELRTSSKSNCRDGSEHSFSNHAANSFAEIDETGALLPFDSVLHNAPASDPLTNAA
mmetsp:Transcript_4524/g.9738  ORF Transcript_4524/g.9738 Transcript_4524/m.9738 type:complete len:103 (+) Transcript_4524:2289-2597(+)